MDTCMTMPGGGPHSLGQGQLTDDSELAMCLMWGLLYSNEDTLVALNSGSAPDKPICIDYDSIA